MAFLSFLLSAWTLLFIVSKFAWTEQLQSHRSKAVVAFAIAFASVGISHIVAPHKLVYMVEGWLPFPVFAVLASGAAEIVLGILLLIPRYRRIAAYGIIAMLVLMFPANINVALHNLPAPGGLPAEPWYVWSRLAFQPVYIAWVWWAALRRSTAPEQRGSRANNT